MRYALTFTALGAALAWQAVALAATATGPWWGVVALVACLAATLLALAACYASRHFGVPVEAALTRPGWAWLWALLWPYRSLAMLTLRVARRVDREAVASEVAPGLWVGRWPFPDEMGRLRTVGVSAVLNLCAEFRPGRWPEDVVTTAVPLLDGVAPMPDDLDRAVAWVLNRRAEGQTALIHCAQGHGRSATVAAAVLVALGHASDAAAALAIVRASRPRAQPSHAQRQALFLFLAPAAEATDPDN
jgi:Dual specificity phosphatase, catalytic domain